MQDRGVRAAADNGRVPPAHRTVPQVRLFDCCFHFVLELARGGSAHARAVRLARDLDTPPEDVLFERRLRLSQLVEDGRGILDAEPEETLAHPGGKGHCRPCRRRQISLALEQQSQPGTVFGARRQETRVLPVVPGWGWGAAREQACKKSFELPGPHHCLYAAPGGGFLRRENVPFPMLAPRIGIPDEQDLPAGFVARHEHEDGLLLIDAREVEQVAVLPVFVADAQGVETGRGAPENREGLRPQSSHRPRPARVQVVL